MTVLLAGTLCFALVVSGCEGAPAGRSGMPSPTGTAEAAGTAQLPNPRSEQPSAASLAEMGIPLEAPFGATDIAYSCIGGEVAQVDFRLNGVDYTFRGGQGTEDLSGVYGTVTEEVTIAACGADYSQETTYRTYQDGGRTALWQFGELTFSLYAAHPDGNFDSIPDALGRYVANRLTEESWTGSIDPGDDPFAVQRQDAVLTVRDVTAEGLTYQIENRREEELTYGEDCQLWKLTGDRWRMVPYIRPETPACAVAVSSVGLTSPEPQELDWTWLYGALTPGDYRLVKRVSWGSGAALEVAPIFADFTIES